MIEKQLVGLAAELGALAGAPSGRRGPRCRVGAFLEGADDLTAATLRTVLSDDRVTGTAIAKTLVGHGVEVTAYTVSRHRRRGEPNGCRCER
ncbi:hypothetical protein ACFCWY_09025 [Streptomyces sp. NPDC056362]|uniref:hypothetical protein n=1 Tax=unclassified Streptomyces TaxID=2593676 RepID=UPI0035DECB71